MPRTPKFAPPSSYIRYVGPVLGHAAQRSSGEGSEEQLRFIRLNAREGVLKYPYRFPFQAPATQSAAQSFSDLEMSPKHIAQVYFGISVGARARFYHPLDERLLKWDQPTLTLIQERDTGNIEYEDSPIEAPSFNFWLAPTENFVPAFDVENILSDIRPLRTIDVQVLFLAMKYTYEFVTRKSDAETFEKLLRHQIPSRFVSFGGKI